MGEKEVTAKRDRRRAVVVDDIVVVACPYDGVGGVVRWLSTRTNSSGVG